MPSRRQAPEAERPPAGEVLGGSIGFLLSKLGFISSVGFSEALASLHINPGHFAILRIVEAMEGASQQSLAEQMQIPPSRMVGLVDELEQLALLERRRNPDDRRANALYLTSKGGAVLAGATEVATAWEESLCSRLAARERDQLLALLRKVAEGQDLPVGVHPALGQRARPGAPTRRSP